jgi:glycosyltransferase involved in cell wall biosynthesis
MSAIWQFIGYKAYKACKKNDIPYVVTPHSSLMKHAFYDIGNTFIKSLYWRIFGKVVVDNAASIHYLSKGERLESDEFTKGEYFIVPNGIVVDQYKVDILDRNKARLENGIKESEFLILHLGRIHSKKNIEYTIASLPELIQMNDKVRFIIVGNIENREYYLSLKKLAKDYNVEKYIIWKDQIPNNEVKYYYSSANLMVLPSKIEGVSMALTESMVQGLPLLISNRVANYREIESDECGIVVDPTLEATKKALINIVSKKIDLNKMSSNSYNSVVTRYKIEQVASRMLSEYKKILQKKSLINDGK